MNDVVDSRRTPRFSPQFSLYVAIPAILVVLFILWYAYQIIEWLKANPVAMIVGGIILAVLILAKPIAMNIQDVQDRGSRRKLLDAQAWALMINAQQGFNTEVANTITGDSVKVINPLSLAPASKTTNNYLEGPKDGTEDEEYEVEQPTVEEIVAQIPRNSYKIGLGRSLSTGELIVVGLLKKHLKLIGASQRGKSSMAGALMRIMTETHDPEYLQIALLDLENLTCHLFEHLPHVARYHVDGKDIPLVARSHEEVAELLEYIINILNYRYTLTKKQIRQLPMIIVYLEELLSLKDYFKIKSKAKIGDAEKQYARLVFCIKEIARRGLKVKIQLLACAQCDYRDEDLVEAWINIKNGLSFSVKPTAAQAAGFMQYDLLMQNAEDDEPGQFVCEMSEVNDLGLAPYFDLEQLLIAWEEEQERLEETVEGSIVEYQRPYLVVPNSRINIAEEQAGSVYPDSSDWKRDDEKETLVSASEETALEAGLVSDFNDVSFDSRDATAQGVGSSVSQEKRETIKRMINMRMPHRDIAKAVGLYGRKYNLYQQVCQEEGIVIGEGK